MPLGPALAIAVVCGAVAGAMSQIAVSQALAVGVAAISLVPVCRRRWQWQVALVMVAASVSAAHAVVERNRALTPVLPVSVDALAGRTVMLTGRLAADAEPVDSGGARLLVEVSRLDSGEAAHGETHLRAQIYVSGTMANAQRSNWLRGRTVRLPVALREPAVFRNPGSRSERWQALTRGYHLTGTVKSAMLVATEPGPWVEERAAALREFVRRAAVRMCGPERHEAAAIVTAILIGDRAGLDVDVERRLQVAGTYHVMAISGGNVALVAGLLLVGLRPITRSFRVPALATIGGVLVYGWVIGPQPSVSRAVTAACVYLTVECVGWIVSSRHVLSLTAILVTVLDPLTPVLPGAWLSFGATFGILIFASALLNRPGRGAETGARWWSRPARVAASLFAATVAAELMLWPVGATLFSRVGVAGLVLNFVAIPAMAVVQVAGALGVGLIAWWPIAGHAAGGVAAWAATLLVGSASLVDVAPWLSWRVPPSPVWWVLGYYTGVGFVWWGSRWSRVRRAGACLVVASLGGILLAPTLAWSRPSAPWVRLTLLDVGQGDGLVVQFPGGRSLVVDAGGTPSRFDMGDRVVAPALWALGVRRLDWLVVTHPDLDHIGGAASVASIFRPREVWEGVPVPRDARRNGLYERVAANGATWREARRGDRVRVGAVTLDVLNPSSPDWERQKVRNDDSLVLRLRYGTVELLLTGDISAEVERTLFDADEARERPLRLLKVAHHGSRTSSSPAFLSRYAPIAALVSAGKGNTFGHPAPEVVARLEKAGARVFRTDRDGAITVETDGRELRLRTSMGEVWQAQAWGVTPGP